MRISPPAWTWPRLNSVPSLLTPGYETVASGLNFIAALLGVIVLLPVLALTALAVYLTSRGPVVYRGARVGKGGRIITIYKFRTMRVGAEEVIGARLVSARDRVVTPVGRVLRYTKLDELPQLVNVIQGDMSLVGPRPVRPVFLREFSLKIPGYTERFAVAPGITGLAQLRGGYYTTPKNKLRYDLLYISSRSLLLDLKIIVGTLLNLAVRIAVAPFRRPQSQ